MRSNMELRCQKERPPMDNDNLAVIGTDTTATASNRGANTATNATTQSITMTFPASRRKIPRPSKKTENAVYGYIQAIRALKRTQVTTSEIAAALSIPESAVIQTIAALRKKGVKFAR